MIRIRRGNPPDNTNLKKKNQTIIFLRKIYDQEEKPSWDETKIKLWGDCKVKKFLYESQYGKCAYCERKRDQKELDVEHFRPKGGVCGIRDHRGYWWIAYEWSNLLLSCKTCNQNKKTAFPLEDESKRAYGEEDDILREKPTLINPLQEDPEKFLSYHIQSRPKPLMVKVVGKNQRGNKTKDTIGLNNRNLMEERAERINHYEIILSINEQQKLDDSLKKLIEDTIQKYRRDDSLFAGLARYYFEIDSLPMNSRKSRE